MKSRQPSRVHSFARFVNFALAVAAVTFAMATAALSQTEQILYSFSPSTGQYPTSGVIFDAAGNLYGTTSGTRGPSGTAFELSPVSGTWQHTLLSYFPHAQDGRTPLSGLISDAAGNFYGTTMSGGNLSDCIRQGCGVVFELSPVSGGGWNETILYNFTGTTDGGSPQAGLIFDAAGNLYGTTYSGGNLSACDGTGCGVVFKLSPSSSGWTQSVLYTFTGGPDGSHPAASLTFDVAGNLYGTASEGGKVTLCGGIGCGVVFKLSPAANGLWKETSLHTFTGAQDGADPLGTLLLDAAGNLYGTTYQAGNLTHCSNQGCGAVFELSPNALGWRFSVIHTFDDGRDGAHPAAGLISDSAANLFGTTEQGGNPANCPTTGCGTVFELSPSSGNLWHETLLHAFTGHPDGEYPKAPLIFDAAGNLYGTTLLGGESGGGVVFEIIP